MTDYLQQLEKLGALHSSGVLSDEEFKAEKARILERSGLGATIEATTPWWRSQRNTWIAAAGCLIVAVGSYVGVSAMDRQRVSDAKTPTVAASDSADPEGSLQVRSDCTASDALGTIIRQVREAGAGTDANARLVKLTTLQSAEASPAQLMVGDARVQLATIPYDAKLQGLTLSAITSFDWEGGEGFRLTFSEPPEKVRSALVSGGLKLSNGREATDRASLLTPVPEGASLTCLKSDQVTASTSSSSEQD